MLLYSQYRLYIWDALQYSNIYMVIWRLVYTVYIWLLLVSYLYVWIKSLINNKINHLNYYRNIEPCFYFVLSNFLLYLQKGTKGDNVQITVKVEFGEKVLGESPKVDCVPDTPAEIDYTATLNCSFEDPLVLDEISYKPVVCKC